MPQDLTDDKRVPNDSGNVLVPDGTLPKQMLTKFYNVQLLK